MRVPGEHTQEFTYDERDRIVEVKDQVLDKTFTTTTTYDALGRVSSETSPNGYTLFYSYSPYSDQIKIRDNKGNEIWEALDNDVRGPWNKYKLGTAEVESGYDYRGYPTFIRESNCFSLAYEFDALGRMAHYTDEITNQRESYHYDTMNRLETWVVSDASGNNAISHSQYYDPGTGNITGKTSIGDHFSYNPNTKPHALLSFNPYSSVQYPTEQVIQYTDFKKVKRIVQGNKELTIRYGTGEQRIQAEMKSGSTTTTRYYIGSYQEEKEGNSLRKINYISAGTGLAAIHVEDSAGNSMIYYAYTDYKGSLMALQDKNGNIMGKYAYDPWGNRRNPMDWHSPDNREELIVDRGYTLHEHLDAFNLINMNGRVYDPQVGMFLSPDPYVQAPGNWMNYNRYSYCLNNPMMYTDPSGELFWILPNISWSPNGGWNFGISAGIGMPGFGIYASIGYAPKANDFSVSIGASIGGFNASMGYNSSMGYNFGVGYNFGIPGSETMSPFNIMTNFTSFGTHWTQKGGWNASISSVSIGRNGATYNPEIGIGVTWAKGVAGVAELSPNEYINLGLEVDYIAEISTNEQLAEFLESNGININDYGADKIDIEGLSKIIERKGYYRVFGIIQNATGADIGGICEYGFNGFSAYADIYLSPHNSEHSLMISLNHEFIHSWQWKTLGRHFAHSKKLKANFDIFTETSASLYTKQFYPNFYVPKYEGIFSPYIRRWPQLPVIN